MMRLDRSWQLAKASWNVLREDKQLLWLPVLSTLMALLTLGVFGLLIFFTLGHDTGVDGSSQYSASPATWLLTGCLYVALAYVQTYFLAALCAGANERLLGGDPTLKGSLDTANNRAGRLLPWAVVQATVSVVISSIERRGIIGNIVGRLVGAAWAVVTFLTVPIIVFEDVGPVEALKRSGALFRQTWGENLVAQVGFGLVGFVAMLPAIAVMVLGFMTGTWILAVPLVLAAVVWMVGVSLVLSALSAIFRTALYRYAVDGMVPAPFAGAGLDRAFGPRQGGRSGGSFGGFSTGGFSGDGF